MTKLLVLFGCYDLEKKEAAPEPGTPAASQYHRPSWATHSGYAPSPPSDILREGQAYTGPIVDGLLTCSMTTTYRGYRQGVIASLMNHDTRSPDSDGLIWQDSQYVVTSGPSNSSRGTFGAAKISAEDGDPLKLTLQDRGFFRSHQYDVLTASYGGELPVTLVGTSSEATCSLVPRSVVETYTKRAVAACKPGMDDLAARVPDLQAMDFGRQVELDPRPNIQDVAGLVGWDDPTVRGLVDQVEASDERFQTALGEAMVAHRPQMGTNAELGGLFVEPAVMECARFGYRKHGGWTDCGLEITWHQKSGPDEGHMGLFDGAGGPSYSSFSWVEVDAEDDAEPIYTAKPTDRDVRVIVPIEDPNPPYQLRVTDGQEIAWVAVSCTGPRCS
ncbi:MAG: hypothetical protein GY913_35285 [Proteobacteria bacterium]|nr:hypothetical protein [Pseudomonadota bacterium]